MAGIIRIIGFVLIAIGALALISIPSAASTDVEFLGSLASMLLFSPGLLLLFAGFFALANAQTKLATLDASDIALATYAATLGIELEKTESFEDYLRDQTPSQ